MTAPDRPGDRDEACVICGYGSSEHTGAGEMIHDFRPGDRDQQHPVDCVCPLCRKRYPDPPLDDGERSDQQQAAEVVGRAWYADVEDGRRVTAQWGRLLAYEQGDELAQYVGRALVAARAEGRAEEAARWQAKIKALIARTHPYTWISVADLRALLDDGERDKR